MYEGIFSSEVKLCVAPKIYIIREVVIDTKDIISKYLAEVLKIVFLRESVLKQ
jgi:hypothetical protein